MAALSLLSPEILQIGEIFFIVTQGQKMTAPVSMGEKKKDICSEFAQSSVKNEYIK
jgi:hypothetical protein